MGYNGPPGGEGPPRWHENLALALLIALPAAVALGLKFLIEDLLAPLSRH